MHVQYSNRVINILRIIQTQILNRYRQEWCEAARALLNDHAAGHDLVLAGHLDGRNEVDARIRAKPEEERSRQMHRAKPDEELDAARIQPI